MSLIGVLTDNLYSAVIPNSAEAVATAISHGGFQRGLTRTAKEAFGLSGSAIRKGETVLDNVAEALDIESFDEKALERTAKNIIKDSYTGKNAKKLAEGETYDSIFQADKEKYLNKAFEEMKEQKRNQAVMYKKALEKKIGKSVDFDDDYGDKEITKALSEMSIPGFAYGIMTEPGHRAARWGAYAGANLVGRVVTGGGPIHNNTGERDIMGVPFI